MLEFKKHWIKIGKEYHLLVDSSTCGIRYKKFRVYANGSESIVNMNKIIKENALLEHLKTQLNRKDIQLV